MEVVQTTNERINGLSPDGEVVLEIRLFSY